MINFQKRRDFIKTFAGGLLGSAAFSSGLIPLLAHASAKNDYKALVCINLGGGNDGFNTLVPLGNSYSTYQSIRQTLALDKSELLKLNILNTDMESCGLHPSLKHTQRLFNQGQLAWISDLGNLIEPVTHADYRDRKLALPPHLFSHNDQTIFTHTLNTQDINSGWAGRIADALAEVNTSQPLSLNVSLSGENYLQRNRQQNPYIVRRTGINVIDALSEQNPANFSASRAAIYREFLGRQRSHLLQQHFSNIQMDAWVTSQYVTDILASQPKLDLPIHQTSHQSISKKGLVESLGMVIRLIAAQDAFKLKRQIFFIDIPGFDTHKSQLAEQRNMLNELDLGLDLFNAALTSIGYQNQVTLFTLSEFGRTLTRNGNDGTDHGWTNHHLVMGGAVSGQQIVGKLPDMNADSDFNIGDGRIIPQTSFDQLGATLSNWFGVETEDISKVFPNLANFDSKNLGFIKPT
jgi:uncharacterized protein (DUF1501 family)